MAFTGDKEDEMNQGMMEMFLQVLYRLLCPFTFVSGFSFLRVFGEEDAGKDMEMSCDEAVLRFWSNRSGEANEIRITELIKGSVRFGAPFPALLSLFSFLVIRKEGIPVFHNAHYGLAGVLLNFVSGVVIVFVIAARFAVNAACAASAEL